LSGIDRRSLLSTLALVPALTIPLAPTSAPAQAATSADLLPSWRGGDAKRRSWATREYAYGPAQGLPDSKVGTFAQALYDEDKKDGRTFISMKNNWNRIFVFDE
jgi:hypothetical protein